MFDAWKIQSALHERTKLAFRAARSNALPGTFTSWETDGLVATCASDPGLRFLSSIVATEPAEITTLARAIDDPRWAGNVPGIVLYHEPEPSVAGFLRNAGYTVRGWRPVAVRSLLEDEHQSLSAESLEVNVVTDSELDAFIAVLLSGYEVHGHVARFIEAEHRDRDVQRFAIRNGHGMIAVAGMTIHGTVAVLGGAATLPAERGRGAQAALLRHRLRVARQAGCVLAVATAAHESPSARNLAKSGFIVHNRLSWHKPG